MALNSMFATHLPSLFYCVLKTDGAVLEIGAGRGSTPLLRSLCESLDRIFYSIESDPQWAALCESSHSENYEILQLLPDQWSVVFIDNAPESRRWLDALLFKDKARFIVMHDLESAETAAGFKEYGHFWKYNRQDTSLFPHTLILSQEEI